MLAVLSLADAIAAGSVKYFTGKPCKHGHVAPRNVKGRHCTECVLAAIARMRARFGEDAWNERERARNMDYIKRNREKKRASARASMAKAYKKNPKLFIERSRANEQRLLSVAPERVGLSMKARNAAYRVRNCGRVSVKGMTAKVRQVWDEHGGKCAACHSVERLELDHIIPLAAGGTNERDNLQILCRICNRSKSASNYAEWLQGRSLMELHT